MVRIQKATNSRINNSPSNQLKSGFMLLESVIYLTCSAFLMSMLALMLGMLYKKSAQHSMLANRYFDLILALDALTNDIQHASGATALWKKLEKDHIVFTSKTSICGWSMRGTRLMRDQDKKRANLVAQQVKRATFKPVFNKAGEVSGLIVELAMLDAPERFALEAFVAIRKGRQT